MSGYAYLEVVLCRLVGGHARPMWSRHPHGAHAPSLACCQKCYSPLTTGISVQLLDLCAQHACRNPFSHWQDKRKTVGEARSTFMSAMSDAGLKPTVVYHNLSPAVLYEKVRAASQPVSVLCTLISDAVRVRAWGCTACSLGSPLGRAASMAASHLRVCRCTCHWSRPVRHRFAQWTALQSCSLQALAYEPGSHLVSSGALATLSGAKTGRTPKDKRVVREAESEANVW